VSDRGSGSVLIIAASAVMMMLTVALGAVASAVILRSQVQRAADLVALAAAPLHEDEPCDIAAEIADLNGVELISCAWNDGRSDVAVRRQFGPVIKQISAQASAEVVLPPLPGSPAIGVLPPASPAIGVLPPASP
jgi:secretion/DNA translocation related TadE-like protein